MRLITEEGTGNASVQLGGLKIASATPNEALKGVERLVSDGGHHYVCFCEANLLAQVMRSGELKRILQQADLTLPDGVSLTLLARIKHTPLAARVSGPSFFLSACEYGVARGWRHFLYGGAEGVADQLAEKMRRKFAGIQVVGTYSPPFRPLTSEEERAVRIRIEQAHPHLLWVGLGGPKQEHWMADHLNQIDVPVMLGVGAAFDFHSGQRPWAPACVRRAGLEWLFRALTGGHRTLWRNARCVPVVASLLVHELLEESGLR